jgi:hypothetical protein
MYYSKINPVTVWKVVLPYRVKSNLLLYCDVFVNIFCLLTLHVRCVLQPIYSWIPVSQNRIIVAECSTVRIMASIIVDDSY